MWPPRAVYYTATPSNSISTVWLWCSGTAGTVSAVDASLGHLPATACLQEQSCLAPPKKPAKKRGGKVFVYQLKSYSLESSVALKTRKFFSSAMVCRPEVTSPCCCGCARLANRPLSSTTPSGIRDAMSSGGWMEEETRRGQPVAVCGLSGRTTRTCSTRTVTSCALLRSLASELDCDVFTNNRQRRTQRALRTQ